MDAVEVVEAVAGTADPIRHQWAMAAGGRPSPNNLQQLTRSLKCWPAPSTTSQNLSRLVLLSPAFHLWCLGGSVISSGGAGPGRMHIRFPKMLL